MRRPALSFSAKTNAGIARREGRSPSAARKLPEQKPRSPRRMTKMGKPQRGASGGMQGGPRRGRSPITGPALPHAAQADKTTEVKKLRARRAQKPPFKGQTLFCFLQGDNPQYFAARRAYPRLHRTPRRRPKLPKKKRPPITRRAFYPYGAQTSFKTKNFSIPARSAYFHKLLYFAAMPSVRSTSLSTSPSTSS